VLAALLLAEPLSFAQILGGLLVLSGVGLANRRLSAASEVPDNLVEVSGRE
jgi:drug/metabolite transporter (DMT)-like permease